MARKIQIVSISNRKWAKVLFPDYKFPISRKCICIISSSRARLNSYNFLIWCKSWPIGVGVSSPNFYHSYRTPLRIVSLSQNIFEFWWAIRQIWAFWIFGRKITFNCGVMQINPQFWFKMNEILHIYFKAPKLDLQHIFKACTVGPFGL